MSANEKAGIIDYGVYIPRLRIKAEEYIKSWGSFAAVGIEEKAVLDFDEDVITMAVAAAKSALQRIKPSEIDIISIASTTFPYANKVMAGTLVSALGLPHDLNVTEHGTSTKAGMEAFLSAAKLCNHLGLAVIADAPQASLKDPVEHGLGAAATAFVFSKEKRDFMAFLEGEAHHVEEHLGDRFIPKGSQKIKDLELSRYAEEGMSVSIRTSVTRLLEKLKREREQYSHVIIHSLDARQSWRAGLEMGFSEEQLKGGFMLPKIGDTGACIPFLGLANMLDHAAPDETVLLVAQGGGLASSAISLKVTDQMRRPDITLEEQLKQKEYISFVQYLKLRGAIK